MYTYTQHYSQETLARGAAVYAQHCAACHGESGRGDGPEAAELIDDPGDLTDLEKMSLNSDTVLYNIVTEGVGGMEGFADELSEPDRRAVAYYTRTLSLANADAIGIVQPAETPEVTAAETTAEAAPAGTVAGVVTNGTLGGDVPDDLEVTLFRLDAEFNRSDFTVTVDADGAFSFADVPIDAQSTYIVAVTYRDRIFTSQAVLGEGESLNLPVTIYELTEDPAVLSIVGMVTRINVVDDRLEVTQVFNIANSSDRAYSTSQTTEDGRPISAAITLPPGAIVAGFTENQRYVVLPEQFTVLDTAPVLPDTENIIQLVYLIDYNGGAIIEQPMNYALNGPARVLLYPTNMQFASGQLAPRGEEALGGIAYASYGAELNLSPGDAIRFELSGTGATADQRPEASVVSANNLPIFIALVIGAQVLIIGGLYWLYSRRQRGRKPVAGEQPLIDALIRQIAELDAEFEAGKLDEASYERQRAAFKERLAALMEKEAASR
jgi:cytochrome c553